MASNWQVANACVSPSTVTNTRRVLHRQLALLARPETALLGELVSSAAVNLVLFSARLALRALGARRKARPARFALQTASSVLQSRPARLAAALPATSTRTALAWVRGRSCLCLGSSLLRVNAACSTNGCATCDSLGNCLTCPVTGAAAGTVIINGRCQTCVIGCQTCTNATSCLPTGCFETYSYSHGICTRALVALNEG